MTDHPSLLDLGRRLEQMGSDAPPPVESGRRGAVLVLLDVRDDGSVGITYTRRQDTLSSHPGQISFPGGRVDPGETIQQAALREAEEEVALRKDTVTVIGQLPAFYIPPSRFWMTAVAGRWDSPHDLRPSDGEVAEILHVSTTTLAEEARWRSVPLSAAGPTWAWQLDGGRLLWGATAVVTGIMLDLIWPGWSGGVRAADLADDRQVRPWETDTTAGRGVRPKLADVQTVRLPSPGPDSLLPGDQPDDQQLDVWAAGVTTAVTRLRRRGEGPIVVLCGPGTIGAVGRRTGERLLAAGHRAQVVDTATGVDTDVLADAGVIVDAILGRGLRGLLADPLLAVVRALRSVDAPIVAVDLPTGIHARDGVVGEAISADVTVSDRRLVPGHVAGGALPFVADLYVVDGDDIRRADVADRAQSWGE